MRLSRNSILQASLWVTLLALASKAIGFFRETLIAGYYGATAETDAFFLAQSMPGMIFPSVCNSLSTAFITLYVTRSTSRGEDEGDLYASRMVFGTLLISLALSLVGVLLASPLMPLLAPGFTPGQVALAAHLTRLTMAAFPLTMLQYMLTAILNAKKLFVSSQVAALAYNLVVILATYMVGDQQSMDLLTLSVIGGHVTTVMLLAILCWRHVRFKKLVNPLHPDTVQLVRMGLPILLGNSVVQIQQIVDKALGSTLPEGSLSAINYGNTLGGLVVTVLVTSLTTVLYPNLTREAAEGDTENYGQILTKSMSGLTALMVPITCVTILCAKDVVEIVYGRGSFDSSAVESTSLVLACYAPMFLFCAVREVLTRAYFAIQDTKTPMINSAISVSCNVVLSLVLTPWLGIVGITLGTSISTLLTALLLLKSIRKKMPQLCLSGFYRNLFHQIAAGAIGLGVVWGFFLLLPIQVHILRFATATVVCFSIYALCLWLLNGRRVICR